MSLETAAIHGLRIVLTIAGIVVAFVLGLRIVLLVLEPRLTFLPVGPLALTPSTLGLPYEDVAIRTEDGLRLHAWFIPAGAPGARSPLPIGTTGRTTSSAAAGLRRPLTLLHFHGNAENIGDCLPLAALTRAAGYNLLLVDYRGYGGSQGQPSERGIYRDGAAALGALRARSDVDPERIVVWGRSIGGAVAVHLAASDRVAGLILESSFSSARDLLRDGGHWLLYAASRFGSYRFDSARLIGRVAAPIVVIHGSDDDIAPLGLGRRLYDLAPGRKEFVVIEGGGHNDLLALHADALWGAVSRFLKTIE
ncbi:MAG TPA: alpha/beta hydrolase [Candidatus Polarisedimenticolia bacterium]|nr:alpha/beta hydrolase [Candidatus Polarisedimenticolia bacterium]